MNIASFSGVALLSIAGAVGSANATQVNLGGDYKLDSAYGKVIEKHIDPKNRKTIFYVLDHHARGNGASVLRDGLDPIGLQVQGNIFPILDGLLQNGKKNGIGFVHEGWDKKIGESGDELVRRNIAGNLLKPHLMTPNDIRVPLDGGYNKAKELAGKSYHQSSELISAVYGSANGKIEHLVPNSSYSVQVTDDYRMYIIQEILTSDTQTCKSIGRNSPYSVGIVSNAIFNKDITLDQESKNCGCDGMREYSKILGDWFQHRLVDSAKAEIVEAKKSKYDYVIINVGASHAFHGLKYAKQMGVNYYVIAPNGIDAVHVKNDPILEAKEDIKANLAVCKGETLNSSSKLTQLINSKVEAATQKAAVRLREAEK